MTFQERTQDSDTCGCGGEDVVDVLQKGPRRGGVLENFKVIVAQADQVLSVCAQNEEEVKAGLCFV